LFKGIALTSPGVSGALTSAAVPFACHLPQSPAGENDYGQALSARPM